MNNDPAPRRQLSLLQTSAVIVGSVIGSGVFINLPIVAQYAGSPIMSAAIWCIGGLFWIPQIMILTEMGTAYPAQGGAYVYLVRAGSPLLGFLYAWTAFLTSDTPTLTIVGLSAASALTFFFPALGIPLYARLFAAFMILSLGYVQYRSVPTGGNVQIILTLAKLFPLVAIVVIGLFYLDAGNLFYAPPTPDTIRGESVFSLLTAGISATLWAYAGFTNILYMGGEVKNPSRTLPISLMGSILFVMTAYTLISLCTSAIVPFHDLRAAVGGFVNPFAYLDFFGTYAGGFFAIAATISMIGVLNASIMTQPRLEYAIARDGLFFRSFGHLHPRYLTPDYSIAIQCCLSLVLFLLGGIENMLGYFTLSYVLQNALMYSAIFFLRRKPDYRPTYRAPAWALMAVLAIASQLYIAYGTFLAYPAGGVLACLGLILSGVPVYWYFKTRRPPLHAT
jgi:fructoselysine transporter